MEKIAIRVYTKSLKKDKHFENKKQEESDYSKVLVFDCETTTDYAQNLTFGSYRYYNNSVGDGYLEETALFYNPKIVSAKELTVLHEYASKHNLQLITADEFVQKFYYLMLNKKAVCIGHNLVFDISRFVKHFGYRRGNNKGNFSLQISEDKNKPRIRTRRISEGKILLDFGGTKWRPAYRGTFIDTQILASALFERKRISLKDLADLLKIEEGKLEVKEHGKITSEYIEYNLRDTSVTYKCFMKLVKIFKEFELVEPVGKIVSTASIGKAVLRKMGIKGFPKLNTTISPELIGKVMSAFFGGRSEVKCRRERAKVTVLDFTSMYPTIGTLMNLKEFVIAEKIEYSKTTAETQKLLDSITLEELYKPETWKELIVLCKIKPENDCLPVRSDYNGKTYNIGINYLTTDKELYYFLPDLIFSKLITGKTPKLLDAIQFTPKETQKGLKEIQLFGITINPRKDDFIKTIVEERARIKATDKPRAHGLKIIANSTSYGIFVEMHSNKEKEQLQVYSDISFESFNYAEKEGEYFNPIIAVSLVSGARLLLGMVEKELALMGKTHYACDTDSMFVPPETAIPLQEKFQRLNPYKEIKQLLKIENESVWFYGISAKRYVLFSIEHRVMKIHENPDKRDYKLHGLGHILNPFGEAEKDWHKIVWEDIYKLEYGGITEEEINEKYSHYYTISKLSNSSFQIAQRFKTLNKNKLIENQIKPFNFFMIGTSTNKEIKPIAPFTTNPQEIVYNQFIDYETGNTMQGAEHFQNLSDFILKFANHPESKLLGETGILERQHINTNEVIHIGKETKNIQDQQIEQPTVNHYLNKLTKEEIQNLTWEQAKKLSVPKSTYYSWVNRHH
ncbi:MAG: hypothetical protein WC462_00075 [archaeon]